MWTSKPSGSSAMSSAAGSSAAASAAGSSAAMSSAAASSAAASGSSTMSSAAGSSAMSSAAAGSSVAGSSAAGSSAAAAAGSATGSAAAVTRSSSRSCSSFAFTGTRSRDSAWKRCTGPTCTALSSGNGVIPRRKRSICGTCLTCTKPGPRTLQAIPWSCSDAPLGTCFFFSARGSATWRSGRAGLPLIWKRTAATRLSVRSSSSRSLAARLPSLTTRAGTNLSPPLVSAKIDSGGLGERLQLRLPQAHELQRAGAAQDHRLAAHAVDDQLGVDLAALGAGDALAAEHHARDLDVAFWRSTR